MKALFLTLASTAALIAQPVAANCPQGSQIRTALKNTPDPPRGASMPQMMENIALKQAYSVLVWDAYGKSGIEGDYVITAGLAGCYRMGNCGIAQDRAFADELGSMHVTAYRTKAVVKPPAQLPERPPASAVSWARSKLGHSCATTTRVAGRSDAVLGPSQPAKARPSSTTTVRTVSESELMERHLQSIIAEHIRTGNVDALREYPLSHIATVPQKAQAIDARMNYWQQPGRTGTTYGLSDYSAYWLKPFTPYISASNRPKFIRTVRYIGQRDAQRGRIRAHNQNIDRMLNNFGQMFNERMAQSGGSTGSGRSAFEQSQWEAYIRGRANREPCSVSNPCGPNSQFRKVK